ncbi:MAG: flavodoxin family protein [Geminicoccaceae bacterium]|nr:flavodoxin family protein [Geminicoccaceae bacterium]MCB9943593.1 flavodoxin family protein [Geminicoccaceae bacterium]
MTRRLLILAHVPSPNTRGLRDAAARGAMSPDVDGVDVDVRGPFETGPDDVFAADALLLGTTENLGYMAGAVKDFFDRCYYPCMDKTEALPFSYYVRAGMDGTGTRRAIESITTGLRWKLVHEPVTCKGAWNEKFLADIEELGLFMAAGLEAGIF